MSSTLKKQAALVPANATVDNASKMEASAARRPTRPAPRVPPRLLRLASDERLVEYVRAGSEAAFEVVFDRHHRGILAFCRHMLGSPEEAEDAVQHTFMAAYRSIAGSRRAIQLRPWLYTIARNRCLSVLRARRERPVDDLDELATENLAAEVQRREDLRDLLRDVGGLPRVPRRAPGAAQDARSGAARRADDRAQAGRDGERARVERRRCERRGGRRRSRDRRRWLAAGGRGGDDGEGAGDRRARRRGRRRSEGRGAGGAGRLARSRSGARRRADLRARGSRSAGGPPGRARRGRRRRPARGRRPRRAAAAQRAALEGAQGDRAALRPRERACRRAAAGARREAGEGGQRPRARAPGRARTERAVAGRLERAARAAARDADQARAGGAAADAGGARRVAPGRRAGADRRQRRREGQGEE